MLPPLSSEKCPIRLAQVGLGNNRVLLNLFGRPFGDLFAEVQNHDPVGEVHDHAHIVFDEQNRHPPFAD